MAEDIPGVEIKEDKMKAEAEKVATGVAGVLLSQLVIRFVQMQLINIWLFVLVYPTVLLYISLSKRGYFSLTPDDVTQLIRMFSFGAITDGTIETGGIFHYLFLWMFVFAMLSSLIDLIREKVSGKKRGYLSILPAIVLRVKRNAVALLLFIIPTMILYVLAFGWEGVSTIPLIYIFAAIPTMTGGVIFITVLERAVMIIGERYFGMKYDIIPAKS